MGQPRAILAPSLAATAARAPQPASLTNTAARWGSHYDSSVASRGSVSLPLCAPASGAAAAPGCSPAAVVCSAAACIMPGWRARARALRSATGACAGGTAAAMAAAAAAASPTGRTA